MLLSAYIGKQCEASNVRFFLNDFKEELIANNYEININTDENGKFTSIIKCNYHAFWYFYIRVCS